MGVKIFFKFKLNNKQTNKQKTRTSSAYAALGTVFETKEIGPAPECVQDHSCTPSLLFAGEAAAGLTQYAWYTDFFLVSCKVYLKVNIAVSQFSAPFSCC